MVPMELTPARRRRRIASAWGAVGLALLLAGCGGSRPADGPAPGGSAPSAPAAPGTPSATVSDDDALADFTAWYLAQHDPPVSDDAVETRVLGDVDASGDADFVAVTKDTMWCGSGGCTETVYRHFPGFDPAYHEVFAVLGGQVTGTRAEPGFGFLSLEVTEHHLLTGDDAEGTPALTVYRFNGAYVPASYELDCAALEIDCDGPILSVPSVEAAAEVVYELAPDGWFPVEEDAEVLVAPRDDADPTPVVSGPFDPSSARVIGVVPGEEWLLVDAWKGTLGFVRLTR